MSVRKYLPEPIKCDVCESGVYYVESIQKFGHLKNERTVGMWKCKNRGCQALVSCHPGTRNPVGYMALDSLRRLRAECHKVFDLLWCKNDSPFTRQSAYYWMADVLNIPRDLSNISKLTAQQIDIVIEQSRIVYANHLKEKEITRKGSRKSLANRKMRYEKARKPNVKVSANNYEQYI